MALINCNECNKEISSTAPACPGCGAPLSSDGQATTIQETRKSYKLNLLISSLLFWGGIIWVFKASPDTDSPGYALLSVIAGLVWYLITKFNIWWNHK